MKATKTRLVERTNVPAFTQLCAIVRQVITENPDACEAELKELVKLRHVTLGYLYDPRQIPRAMDAVERVMHRINLTPDQVTALREAVTSSGTETTDQTDPPWGPYDRRPSPWTSLRELIEALSTRSR